VRAAAISGAASTVRARSCLQTFNVFVNRTEDVITPRCFLFYEKHGSEQTGNQMVNFRWEKSIKRTDALTMLRFRAGFYILVRKSVSPDVIKKNFDMKKN
jgi:hypothetical protein